MSNVHRLRNFHLLKSCDMEPPDLEGIAAMRMAGNMFNSSKGEPKREPLDEVRDEWKQATRHLRINGKLIPFGEPGKIEKL